MWILAVLIDGLFDKGRPRGLSGKGPATGRREDAEAAAQRLLRSLCNEEGVTDAEQGGAYDQTEEERDNQELRAGSTAVRFDWGPYRAVFKDTPLHAALTAMLAEYALLVGRFTRRLGAAAVTPVTLGEGASMAEQARKFILHYATPILGTMGTTKVHRLLCLILHSVRYHGNILNAKTSANESRQKANKRQYSRTNKRKGYTRQLVRRDQGTASVLRRNEDMRRGEEGTPAKRRRCGGGSDGYAADVDEGVTRRPAQMANAPDERVRRLAERPGLSGLADFIGVSPDTSVGVPSYVYIDARLPHEGALRQVVRTSPLFHGEPWHDHVQCRLPCARSDAPARYGQARLLVRLADGVDVLVVAEMEGPRFVDESPLTARGCVQLRWTLGGDACTTASLRPVHLRVVALSDVVRLFHMLPDFADMCRRRRCLGTDPPMFGTTGESV